MPEIAFNASRVIWKALALRLGCRTLHGVSGLLGATGLDRGRRAERLRSGGNRRLIATLRCGDLLPAEAGGHPLYVFGAGQYVVSYILRPYEPYTLRLFSRAVRPGAVVLDIGAHLGCFTVAAAHSAGTAGSVVAFEPCPANFELLQRNIKLNGLENVRAVAKAVSSENTQAMLTLHEDPQQHTLLAIEDASAKGNVSVECVSIDDFLSARPVDVIKMDIEGNELRALEGMRRTIDGSSSVTLFIEVNPEALRQAGSKPDDLFELLRGLGFRLSLIDEERRCVQPLTGALARQIEGRPPGWYGNLYCIKGA